MGNRSDLLRKSDLPLSRCTIATPTVPSEIAASRVISASSLSIPASLRVAATFAARDAFTPFAPCAAPAAGSAPSAQTSTILPKPFIALSM
jgi:hypothetical protein